MANDLFGANPSSCTRLINYLFPLFLVLFTGQASAFSALYAFGDSLSDTGNVYALTGGTTPPFPYYNGRFSNGPLWIDALASNLGLSIDPYLGGGTSFAFGGAVTGAPNTSSTPTLTQQLGLYATASGSVADPNALYVVWGGGNDVRAGNVSGTVSNLTNIITSLAGMGATHFLVPNLPNVGLTPDAIAGGPATVAGATFLSQLVNGQEASAFPTLASGLGVQLIQLDVYGFLNNIVTNPGLYGFTNVNSPCFNGTTVCANPNEYIFWDGIHPTAAASALLGAYAISVLPVPPAVLLFFSALSVLGIVKRKTA